MVSSTMTVTGESDKEIKSMAFTPCSFLLLFRKYFFMTTSVNGKLELANIVKMTFESDRNNNRQLMYFWDSYSTYFRMEINFSNKSIIFTRYRNTGEYVTMGQITFDS